MIVDCPCGKKKFNLDINLIPADGRLLKCGSCSEVWHYKIPSSEQKIINEINNLEINKPDFTPDKNNDDFPIENNINFILDHGYVCPICKDTGIVPCKMCKKGCVFCGYSKFIICKCRLDFT